MKAIKLEEFRNKLERVVTKGFPSPDGTHLIAAESLLDYLDGNEDGDEIDAEPVVRCKDCIHAEEFYSETIWCYLRDSCENCDGYCYRGERREDE